MPDYEAMSDAEFQTVCVAEKQRIRQRDFAACEKHLDDLIDAYGVIGVPGVEAEANARKMAFQILPGVP